MKTLFQALMISSVVGISAPALGAALNLPTSGERPLPLSQAIVVTDDAPDRTPAASAPINLLAPPVDCAPSESLGVCDVRTAAARRAVEVTAGENVASRGATRISVSPFGLLIPVAAVECPPNITVEACARMNGTIPAPPPGPIAPVVPPPPVLPVPPAPDLGVVPPTGAIPPLQTVPEAVTPPIAADPESVIKPPPTASQMPVVKPKPNPPVIQ
jgi:hypothetical protein